MPAQKRLLTLVMALVSGGLYAATKRAPQHPTVVRLLPTVTYRSRVPAASIAPIAPGSTPGELDILNGQGQKIGVCPLKHTDVSADIAGFVARVTVTQQFENPSADPIEAVYTFPLPADAAVDHMTMRIGEREIVGEIKRREEARQIYDAARANGQAAALLDQERPNIFTQSVANVMPGQPVSIEIQYVHLLKYDDGSYEFHFPMVVGPRYIPNGGGYTIPGKRGDPSPSTAGQSGPRTYLLGETPRNRLEDERIIAPTREPRIVTDADRITPPITPPGTRAGHDVSLAVHLDAGLPLQDIRSLLHPVTLERDGPTSASIRLAEGATLPNQDFILRYTVAGSQIQEGLLTHADGNGGGYFTLILQPPLAPPQRMVSPKEMVFVIDQTGSQAGWPIEKAKETMRYCIRNLNPGDTFQLLGFNTELYPCFPAPVAATPETINRALQFLDPIQGSGGTDILKSVDYALRLPDDPGRLRIVCYMTDGYVGNDMQILASIRAHRGRARMFPFGIGNSVNRFLIDGMAAEGRGAPEYVTLDTPGQEAAQRFYRRIASPLLLDPQVDWNGLPIADVYPRQIPDVFTAGPIILKGRYTRAAEGTLTVRGLLRGQPWSRTVHVVLPRSEAAASALPSIWARDRIADLQSQDWMGAQTGQPDPKIHDTIVDTALAYHLMSQYTSFVAVEQHVVNIEGRSRRVDVPVEMPKGVSYSGIFGEPAQMAEGFQVANGAPSSFAYGLGGAAGGVRARAGAPAPSSLGLGTLSGRGAMLREEARKPAIAAPELRELSDEAVADRPAPLSAAWNKVAATLRTSSASHAGVRDKRARTVEIKLWVSGLKPAGLKRLRELGFKTHATLIRGRLLIGSIPVDAIEKLAEMDAVVRIEPAFAQG